MPSGKQYLDFILDQLSPLGCVSYRAMMGEYILYCQGVIFGGIYDNRLLLKPTPAAKRLLPGAPTELPYAGAKPMLLVEDVDNSDFLCALVRTTANELPSKQK